MWQINDLYLFKKLLLSKLISVFNAGNETQWVH